MNVKVKITWHDGSEEYILIPNEMFDKWLQQKDLFDRCLRSATGALNLRYARAFVLIKESND